MVALENKFYRRGVGIMLINKDRKVFVGKRIDNGRLVGTKHWQMPQGGIDRGEEPIHAAFRELQEEVGTDKIRVIAESEKLYHYDFPETLQSSLWGGRYHGQSQKWFLMEFIGEDTDINLNYHNPEFEDWKWVDMDDLLTLIIEFKYDLYEEIIRDFRHYVHKE